MIKNKRGYCPVCHNSLVGLYQMKSSNPKRQWIRRAFFCKKCELVLKEIEIAYKKITFETSGVND